MPPYHGAALKADEKGIYEHFQQISEAVSIPIMIQDAPLSGVSLSVDLLVRMAVNWMGSAVLRSRCLELQTN